ncbi:MAG: hypothetical protein M3R62_04945 [Acidobacteriota bacterium]|nr:hypothetical protein [Acidobacteriota bacterium]
MKKPERVGRSRLRARWSTLAAALLTVTGCTSVAEIRNLSEDSCRRSFSEQLSAILVEQGETAETADRLGERARTAIDAGHYGPRSFLVSAPTGTDYTFFVERKRSGCLLRLYGRRKGFVSYTNNLTYIATRPLAGCACSSE